MKAAGNSPALPPTTTSPDPTGHPSPPPLPLSSTTTHRPHLADLNALHGAETPDPTKLMAQAGAGDRYDHNYVVDVAWSVNDNHRKRSRGTANHACGCGSTGSPVSGA